MGMASKIRILLIKRNLKIKDVAEKLGYKGNNLSNKLRADNFSERELTQIAEICGATFEGTFTLSETGEKI